MFDPAVIQQFVDEIRGAEKARAARESATLKLAAANAGLLKDILAELQELNASFAGLRADLVASEAEPAPAPVAPDPGNASPAAVPTK